MVTTGMVPPDRTKAGTTPKAFWYAAVAARIARCRRSTIADAAGPCVRTEHRKPAGMTRAIWFRNCRSISPGSWPAHEPHIHFGRSARRNDRLDPGTLIASLKTGNFECRPDGCPLVQRIARFSKGGTRSGIAHHLVVGGAGTGHVRPFHRGRFAHAIVKSSDRYSALWVVETRDDGAKARSGL